MGWRIRWRDGGVGLGAEVGSFVGCSWLLLIGFVLASGGAFVARQSPSEKSLGSSQAHLIVN